MKLESVAKKEMCVKLYCPHRAFRLASYWRITRIDCSGEIILKSQTMVFERNKDFYHLRILCHEESRIYMKLKKNVTVIFCHRNPGKLIHKESS